VRLLPAFESNGLFEIVVEDDGPGLSDADIAKAMARGARLDEAAPGFTGRATTEYMKEEHELEYERLESAGRLGERVAEPPPRWLYVGAAILGTGAILIGLTLAGLVVWASLR
jgi:hypothetical protein